MKTNDNCRSFGKISKALFFILLFSAGLFASVANAQTLTTDLPDYPAGATVYLTGSGFQALETITMQVVHADGTPDTAAAHQPWYITADASGGFVTTWIVDIDAVNELLRATADGQSSLLHAEALFTDANPYQNFQGANGQLTPITRESPVLWQNGNLNQAKGHFVEGYTIPYNAVVQTLQSNTDNYIEIQWDIVHSGASAIDFIRSYPDSFLTGFDDPVGSHLTRFGHGPEHVDPTLNASNNPAYYTDYVNTVSYQPFAPFNGNPRVTAPIPLPLENVTPPCMPGTSQPFDKAHSVDTLERRMTMFYQTTSTGTFAITNMYYVPVPQQVADGHPYGDYSQLGTSSNSATRMRIEFHVGTFASSDPAERNVIFAWGGHIAAKLQWGTELPCNANPASTSLSAGGISGSPYHMAMEGLNGTGGQSDLQLSADAVIDAPICSDLTITYTSPVCPNTSQNHVASITTNCTNAVYSWALQNNTSGATPASGSGATATVNSGTTCGVYDICFTVVCDEGTVVCCSTVTVEDNNPPVFISCPPGTDLGCNPTVPTCANQTAPSATDNCGTPGVTCSNGSVTNTSTCGRSKTITWTATDACLNTSNCAKTWTWTEDTTPPAFTDCTPGTDLGCNPTVPTCANITAPNATDACGTPGVTCSNGSITNTSTCGRSKTITWTATDGCLNTATCARTWTWTEDTTPPAFTDCPPGTDLGCNPTVPTCANVTAPNATDACGTPGVTCSNGSVTNTSTCGRSKTIIWTATDGCLNTATCARTWTWTEDTTPPAFTDCTPGTDLGCNPTVPTCANITAPNATDACGTPGVTCSNGSITNTSTCGRSKTITWTATDGCLNTATCARTWTWTEDTTPPAFTNCTPGTDLGCNPTVPTCANITAPNATDACGTPGVTCSNGSVTNTSTCGRSKTITWTATDGCLNTATCARTWTWTEDTTPPAFTNCTPGTDLGCNPTVPTCANVTAPNATDGCGTPGVTCSDGSVTNTSTCGRSKTITWTATDGCLNTATCARTWTWTEDTTPPAFTNCTPGTDLGCNPTVPTCANVTAPNATDGCGTPGVTCSNGSVTNTSTCGRSKTITWTATDGCLNTATCARTWTWTEDTTPPAFTNCTPGTDLGCNPTVPTCANVTAPNATDGCGTPGVTCSNGSVTNTSTCGRSKTITWTATDGCLNTATCARTWTWTEDTTPPAFTNCTPGTDLGCNPTVPTCANVTAPNATDGCGTPGVTCSNGSVTNTSTCGRSKTITWTATDGCLNTATCARTWTWTEDTTPPAFTNCTPGTDLGCNPTVPTCANVTAPNATDGCGTPGVTCSNGSVTNTSTCGRSKTITWTATDGCLNTSTCARTWTWTQDTDPPAFTDCTPGTDLGCNPTVPTCANVTAPNATDGCGTPGVTCSDGSVTNTSTCGRSKTLSWTATDGCLNTSACARTFTWTEDTTPPTISCPDGYTIEGGGGNGGPCVDNTVGGVALVENPNPNGPHIQLGIDFRQPRNEDHPTDPLYWTNGINNITQAEYFEGMGNPQRIIFTGLAPAPTSTPNTHTLIFRHEAVKRQGGVRHAYDFMMSWDQAIETAANIGNGAINELEDLNVQSCNGGISADAGAACSDLTSYMPAPFFPPYPPVSTDTRHQFAELPDDMGNPPNQHGSANVDDVIDCFEATYGNRYIELIGNEPVSDFSIVFDGYSGRDNGDNYAWYTITWTSTSEDVMIKLAGRAAAGAGDCGYGACYGAGSINGGPYHFKLDLLDGYSLGNRDNQIMVGVQECNPNIPVDFGDPSASDDCGGTITPAVIVFDDVTSNTAGTEITHCRTWEATDGCENTATCSQCIVVTCDPVNPLIGGINAAELHCTYSQSFWGSGSSHDCTGETSDNIKTDLLSSYGDMFIGCNEGGNLTLTAADVNCINSRLPAGGANVQILGTNTCEDPTGIPLYSNHRFRDDLLGQVVALKFNIMMDYTLGGLYLNGQYMSVQNSTSCDPSGTATGNPKVYRIPESVLNYLDVFNSVNDLAALADSALCGSYVTGPGKPTLTDINKAVEAINKGFEGCKFLVGFSTTLREGAVPVESTTNSFIVNAYPNPFTSQTSIEFTTENANDNVKVEVFNSTGEKVAELSNGSTEESTTYKVEFNGAKYSAGVYLYRISTDTDAFFDKLILIK